MRPCSVMGWAALRARAERVAVVPGTPTAFPTASVSLACPRRGALAGGILPISLTDRHDQHRICEGRIVLYGAQRNAGAPQLEEDFGQVVGRQSIAASEPVGMLHPQLRPAALGEAPRRRLRRGQ